MIRLLPTRACRFPAAGTLVLLLLFSGPVLAAGSPLPQAGESFGVFVRLGDGASGSFETIANGLQTAIEQSDWQLLAVYDVEVGTDCAYHARVIVLNSDDYAAAVLANGPLAAFALPLRMAVFEDEAGVHIAAVNPQSMNRTIIAEEGFERESLEAVEAMRGMVGEVAGVTPVAVQYGQIRDVGLISKTMGIMAGGPFTGKIETIASADTEDVAAVLDGLYAGFEELADDWKWKVHPVYKLDLSAQSVAILGVTGGPVESRSFGIVGAGTDESRSDYSCPGIAHAASYPIEIVLVRDGDQVNVLIVDTMFRMKMYFEDAGKMSFAMNMRMPGSIESEIRDKVEETVQ